MLRKIMARMLSSHLIFPKNLFSTGMKEKQISSVSLGAIGQPTHISHPYLIGEHEVTPMIHKHEYCNRRHILMDNISKMSLTKNFMVVIPSASKKYMSDKIPYVFRQNTNFLYLTGCQEPDSCLVLTCDGADSYSSFLFVHGRDVQSELWDGPKICPSLVPDYFGIDEGNTMEELEAFIHSKLKSCPTTVLWYDIFHPIQSAVHNVINSVITNRKNYKIESPKSFIEQQRMIKSQTEVKLMKKTCQIASDAIVRTIETSKPGINEHEIFAKVDYECRINGADFLAYPPVVAGGKRANIIHYITNNQIVQDKEMVLLDAGCECHGYSSDITRTWPIGGKFTNNQRELYEAVLYTQEQLIAQCKHLPSLDSLFDSMCKILGRNLQDIGLIPKSLSDAMLVKVAYKFCPHHVSHYLGMDVHDTPSITRNIPMRPGMVITVEPGVYVRENDLSVPQEYRGIGIRIEDDILITENGPEILTNCPKTVDDIENISSRNVE